ncbi:MAG: redoxin domain-containing protein [Dehalococcoidia bacterium]|nr:redoxin domain-containing protein [Dehalococcoidia bacterium]
MDTGIEIASNGEKKMSEVGQMAPDFTLPAHNGEPITLSDFRGEKNVILSFHIFSFTGG